MKTVSKSYFECKSVSAWKWSRFMSIILMTKITLNMWIWEPFHNKSILIVSSGNVWTQTVQMQIYLVTKQPNLVSKQNYFEKARSNTFAYTRWLSLQRLICKIRLSKVCFRRELEFGKNFWSVESYFSCKRLCLQQQAALPSSRN